MTATTLLPTTVLPMGEIDPNTVKPGWIALLIVLALGAATVLLWRNMGKQLKKVDFETTDGPNTPGDVTAGGPAPSGDRPTEPSSPVPAGAAAPTTTDTEAGVPATKGARATDDAPAGADDSTGPHQR